MKPLSEKIREQLEKGITRNKVLPLDWAMDRINPILKEAVEKLKSKRNNGDFVHIREIDKIFGKFK